MKFISACKIKKGFFWNTIHVKYLDGTEEDLATYDPEEITFNKREFIKRHRDDALRLIRKRDFEYLLKRDFTKIGSC